MIHLLEKILYKLTNIEIFNHSDSEWEIRFNFGKTYESVWFHNDMNPKSVIQQITGLTEKLLEIYLICSK